MPNSSEHFKSRSTAHIENNLSLPIYALFASVFILAFGSFNYVSLRQAILTGQWVEHTHEVISEAHHVERLIVDLETGQRGYLITGRDLFLEPYINAAAELRNEFFEIKLSVADNPQQIERIEQIETLLENWFSVAGQREIDVRRSVVDGTGATMADVVALMNAETGKDFMDAMRLKLAQFIEIEKRLLAARLVDQEKQNGTALFVNMFGTLLIIGFALLLMRTMNRGQAQKRDMQVKARELGDSDWVQSATGITSRALLDQTGLKDLAQAAVRTISELLEAEVAAGYLLDAKSIGEGGRKRNESDAHGDGDGDGGQHWEFAAGFALHPDFERGQHIKPGIGLLGQAALDGKVICLGHNKSTQLVITSSIAVSCARAVVVIPVVFGGDTLAVLEFVSATEFNDRQIAFSEKLVGTLGLVFNSFYETHRAEMALEQSQALTIDLKSRQTELEEAKLEAEKANAAKSDFLATVSHEIRTPMNGILGMAQVLRRSELSEDQHVKLESIINSSKSMTNLLNDILDFSKIEKGMIELEPVDFCPASGFRDLESTFAALAGEKNIAFEAVYNVDDDVVVFADQSRIRQIVWNLASNAIKFTQKGQIKLTVTAERIVSQRGSPKNIRLKIAMQDTGIGIPPDRQSSIFEAFTQADSGTSRRFGGTGLGLSIVSNLSEMMGGGVTLTSEEGKGSKFTVMLELPMSDKRAEDLPKSCAPVQGSGRHDRQLRVLIVDDQPLNTAIAKSFVERMGHQVEIAGNGEQAVEAVNRQTFDLVLMDYHMPKMNGDTATRRIRSSDNRDVANLRVVGLTADATSECKNKLIASGMNDILVKPLDEAALSNTIARLFDMKQADEIVAPINTVVDLAGLQTRLGPSRYKSVIKAAGQSLCDLAGQMRDIINGSGNTGRPGVVLHTLKGVAAELGAAELTAFALNVEKQHELDAVAMDTWADLAEMVDHVCDDLDKETRLAG